MGLNTKFHRVAILLELGFLGIPTRKILPVVGE